MTSPRKPFGMRFPSQLLVATRHPGGWGKVRFPSCRMIMSGGSGYGSLISLMAFDSRSPVAPRRNPVSVTLEALLTGVLERDRDATHAFIVAITPTLLATARRVMGSQNPEVEDVVQDAAIHLLRALKAFRHECSLKVFAARVATNRALSARRQAKTRANWTPLYEPNVVDAAPSGEEEEAGDQVERLMAREKRRLIRALLDELPEQQAETVALYFVEGLTSLEIASLLGVPHGTIRSRLRLARNALKERIEGDEALASLRGEGT